MILLTPDQPGVLFRNASTEYEQASGHDSARGSVGSSEERQPHRSGPIAQNGESRRSFRHSAGNYAELARRQGHELLPRLKACETPGALAVMSGGLVPE